MASRSEITRAAKNGEITVDGKVITDASKHIDENAVTVVFRGERVVYREFTYIMMNKPSGYVSSTDDPRERTVLELLPERLRKLNLFPCGRLDKDTVGLLVLTNNGQLAHRMLSPKHHVAKLYAFRSESPLSADDIARLESGVDIGEGYVTKPAKVTVTDRATNAATIEITEGKYHQIKRMLEAVDNKIVFLERIDFAGLMLDRSLERGEWRYLTSEEEATIKKYDL